MTAAWRTPWAIAAAVHVALDCLLLAQPWNLSPYAQSAAVALPVSQNALVAVWACTGGPPLVWRLMLWPFGIAATWSVVCAMMPWPADGEIAAAWGVAFIVQSLIVCCVLGITVLAKPSLTALGIPRRRFSLRRMLLLVTAYSIGLALLRVVVVRSGWSAQVMQWDFLGHVQVLGIYSGCYAIIVYCLSLTTRWRLTAATLGLLLVVGLSTSQVYALHIVFANVGEFDIWHAVAFAAGQGVWLTITLLPLHRRQSA